MRQAIVGMGLVLGLAGCATYQRSAPLPEVADPQVTIRQAEEAGAQNVPDAAQHLEWAREQAQGARKLIEQHRQKDAALFLMRAEADAQLAVALAREAPVRAEADRMLQQVQELQNTVR